MNQVSVVTVAILLWRTLMPHIEFHTVTERETSLLEPVWQSP